MTDKQNVLTKSTVKQMFNDAGFKINKEALDYLEQYLYGFLEELVGVYEDDIDKIDLDLVTAGWNCMFPVDDESESDDDIEEGAEIELADYFPDHIVELIKVHKVVRPDIVRWVSKFGPSLDGFITEEAKVLAKHL